MCSLHPQLEINLRADCWSYTHSSDEPVGSSRRCLFLWRPGRVVCLLVNHRRTKFNVVVLFRVFCSCSGFFLCFCCFVFCFFGGGVFRYRCPKLWVRIPDSRVNRFAVKCFTLVFSYSLLWSVANSATLTTVITTANLHMILKDNHHKTRDQDTVHKTKPKLVITRLEQDHPYRSGPM